MPTLLRILFSLGVITLSLSHTKGEDWPEFRGPTGQGISQARDVPVTWDRQTNIQWKTELPGSGWSSPVVVGERIYLTAAVPAGEATHSGEGTSEAPFVSLRAICLDEKTSKLLWNVEVSQVPPKTSIHSKNSHASPTPIVSNDRIYVHFGTFGTAALGQDGNLIWRKQIKYKPVHGSGGSPIVYQQQLIVNCDGGDEAFVLALDTQTGEERWRTARDVEGGRSFSFSTPLLVKTEDETVLVSAGSDAVFGYEPMTGKQMWVVRYPNKWSVVPRPVYANGLILVCTGYEGPAELLAIRPGGVGDVTGTHVVWRGSKYVPHNPSPLVHENSVFLVSDRGVASCRDLETGELVWIKRLGQNYSASPFFAEGRIYFLSEMGLCTVVKASRTYEELSKNDLEERTLASMVPRDHAVLIRSESGLYRIGR